MVKRDIYHVSVPYIRPQWFVSLIAHVFLLLPLIYSNRCELHAYLIFPLQLYHGASLYSTKHRFTEPA
jgi:hypothetical protein